MGLDTDFWYGKRVFLTGHTGFKGGWLAIWLQQLGAELFGYALAPNTDPNLFTLADVAAGMTSQFADVRDGATLNAAIQQCQPDIVIHMAAQPLVRRSYQHPVETYATNVMGTVHLLEAVRHCDSVRVVVNVTTDKCYENKEHGHPYSEEQALGGYDPYSSSKACSELVTAAYRQSYFHPDALSQHGTAIATARAGNVIGGGDWSEDRLIPDVVRAVLAGQSVEIRYPQATRPWQHVLEPLSGYLMLAQQLWDSPERSIGAWNFGPLADDVRPVAWLMDYLAQHWPGGLQWSCPEKDQPHEAQQLTLDSQKAHDMLGWQPRWDIKSALDYTIDWYRVWLQKTNIKHVMLQQLNDYLEAAK